MKALTFAVRSFRRELHSGEVLVLLAAVALAVAALTSVGFLTDRIAKAISRQANEVLAADLRLRSQDRVPDQWSDLAHEHGLSTAETLSFPSVVFAGDDSALATVKVVSASYPLRGELRVSDALFGEQRIAAGIPGPGEVWAESALLARLGADVGDYLALGKFDVRVSAVLAYRPDQAIGFASLAPAVMLNIEDISRTGLIAQGSRVGYALLVAGDSTAVSEFRDAIENVLPESIRIRSQRDSSERAYSAASRAQQFLSLTVVISLLLCAVAIAMSARRYALRRMDAVALMKSLGATQGFVVSVALAQLLALGLLGVVVGSAAGFAVQEILSRILIDLMQQSELPGAGLRPVVLASTSALVLLIGFALPSLIQLRNTPPLRVLRGDAMPPAPSRFGVGGLALAAVVALLYRSVGDVRLLLLLIGGISVVAGLLYGFGRVLVSVIGRARGGVGVAWRYGLANVARRGRDSAIQVVAFGLGITVLLLLTLVRTDLLETWQHSVGEDAPNHFLINIQAHEIKQVTALFKNNGLAIPEFTPLVRARMVTINEQPVTEREYPNEDGKWLANREANLSWAAQLSSSNELVEGQWWPKNYLGPPLISIEQQSAMNAGLVIGDRLTFFVAGLEVEATIASTRKVNWNSFQPNFFIVFSPGALEGMPVTYVSSMHIASNSRPMLVDLAAKHPSISVIDLGAILSQLRGIIEKASLAVQGVFVFTLLAGVAVLFATVQSTIDERRLESAMLRALGAKRRTVMAGVLAEFAVLGAAAGVMASAGASVMAYLIATRLFELPYSFSPLVWLVGVPSGIVVVSASGFVAARGAVNAKPADVLRGINA